MTQLKQTVVATYESREKAGRVIGLLREAGYDREQISVLALAEEEGAVVTERPGAGRDFWADALGAGLSLFGLLLPGAGLVVAAGPIIGLLRGAAFGTATGRLLVGAFSGLGIPEGQAEGFVQSLVRGRVVISVTDTSTKLRKAALLLARPGAASAEHHGEAPPAASRDEHPTLKVFTLPKVRRIPEATFR